MFGLLLLVGLFVALTPGILFKLKGPKMVVATAHALLFGIVAYVVSVYFMSYDGFQTGPTPICPSGTTFSSYTKLCTSPVVCPSEHTYSQQTGRCIKSSGPKQKPSCPAGFIQDSGMCFEFIEANCPGGGRTDGDSCVIEPTSCPEPYVLTRGDCIAPTQTTTSLMPKIMKPVFAKKVATVAKKPTLLSSIADKNGNMINVGSIAACTGPKGIFNITVTHIESHPGSTTLPAYSIVRGTENDIKRGFNITSCVAASGGESTSIFG